MRASRKKKKPDAATLYQEAAAAEERLTQRLEELFHELLRVAVVREDKRRQKLKLAEQVTR